MAEPARFQRRGDPANNGFSDVGNKLARRLTNCGNAVATTRGAQGVAPPGAIWSSQAFPRRSSNARNRALAFNVPCSLNSQEMLALEMLDCRRFRLGAFLTTTRGTTYRFLLTLTAAAAILTATSLMPKGAAAIPLGERADIATADRQVEGSNDRNVYQCQFRGEYGQGLRERVERLRRERQERRERAERERRERRERLEQERRERRERH